MSAVWLIASVDMRRRWRELVLLGLLVALVSGATMAAVVAAERARTSVDRFLEWSQVSSASFPLNVDEPDRLIEAVIALPEVEAVAVGTAISVFVAADPANPLAGESLTIQAPDPNAVAPAVSGVDIDRPLILDGRLPKPDRAEEILLFEWMADVTGWDVGDRLTAQTLALADFEQAFAEGTFPGLNGPTLELVIVGIGRSGPASPARSGSTRCPHRGPNDSCR